MCQIIKIILITISIALSGCKSALLEMKNDNQMTTERIQQKELILIELEVQRQRFLVEKNNLQSLLNQKNSSLNELGAQIDRLKVANAQIKAQTTVEQNKKVELSRKLDEYSREIKAVSTLSLVDRKKKNEELRQKIRELMEANLMSN